MSVDFISLHQVSQLDDIAELSAKDTIHAVAIFKHSTRCSISSMALSRLSRTWDISADKLPIYYLDLIAHRDVSNEIANRFNIEHESPQLLIIKNGKCIHDSSHNSIDVDDIKSLDFNS